MVDSEGSITDSAPFWGSKAFLAAEQACTVGSFLYICIQVSLFRRERSFCLTGHRFFFFCGLDICLLGQRFEIPCPSIAGVQFLSVCLHFNLVTWEKLIMFWLCILIDF